MGRKTQPTNQGCSFVNKWSFNPCYKGHFCYMTRDVECKTKPQQHTNKFHYMKVLKSPQICHFDQYNEMSGDYKVSYAGIVDLVGVA